MTLWKESVRDIINKGPVGPKTDAARLRSAIRIILNNLPDGPGAEQSKPSGTPLKFPAHTDEDLRGMIEYRDAEIARLKDVLAEQGKPSDDPGGEQGCERPPHQIAIATLRRWVKERDAEIARLKEDLVDARQRSTSLSLEIAKANQKLHDTDTRLIEAQGLAMEHAGKLGKIREVLDHTDPSD